MVGCDPTPLPSPLPSAPPSHEPSLEPTPLPSPEPSPEPTPVTPEPTPLPTPCSNLIEQCPTNCWQVDENLRPPRCTDPTANRPECNELPLPSLEPACLCCPDECLDTEMVGCEPTPLPSPAPTPEPTDTTCDINVEIQASCFTSCTFDTCVERPQRMTMFYRGGGCSGTRFRRCPLRDPDPTPELPNPDPCTCTKEELPCTEWNNKNECYDYDNAGVECNNLEEFCSNGQNSDPIPGCGPPASDIEHSVWIEAFGKDELYFEGKVDVNTTWDAVTIEEKVEAITDIFTYEYDPFTNGKGRLLQHVIFHSSCSQELFLTDQFGAQQLIEFESNCESDRCDPFCQNGRRLITLFQNRTGDFSINLIAQSPDQEPVLVNAILAVVSDGNLVSQINTFFPSQTVPPDLTIVPNFNVRLDENYTINAVAIGTQGGASCESVGDGTFQCVRVNECDLIPDDCECPIDRKILDDDDDSIEVQQDDGGRSFSFGRFFGGRFGGRGRD